METKDAMGDDVVSTVRQIGEFRKKQHAQIRKIRIFAHTIQLDSPIKKKRLPLFKVSATKKMHILLFSQMFISMQIRGGDLEEFYSHEKLQYPPSLSKCGEMRSVANLIYRRTLNHQQNQLKQHLERMQLH